MTILYIICTLTVISITAYLFYIQTENKSKVLIALIGVFILASAYLNLYDHITSKPRATLILDQVEEYYSGTPPDSVIFFIKISNTGNVKAANVRIKTIIKLNNEILYEEETEQQDIEPGQTVRLRVGLKETSFQEIWNNQGKLKIGLKGTYDGGVLDIEAKYNPQKHDGFDTIPSWTIEK